MSIVFIAMLSTALVSLLLHSMEGWASGTGQADVTSSATIALQKLSNDIRDAKSATITTTNTFNDTLTVTFPGTITDPNTGEHIYDLNSANTTTRTYYIWNGELVRSAGGNITTLARYVPLVRFDRDYKMAGLVIAVTLTGQEKVGTCTSKRQVTGRIALRNYRS